MSALSTAIPLGVTMGVYGYFYARPERVLCRPALWIGTLILFVAMGCGSWALAPSDPSDTRTALDAFFGSLGLAFLLAGLAGQVKLTFTSVGDNPPDPQQRETDDA